MKHFFKAKSILLASAIVMSTSVRAEDVSKVTIANQSKTSDMGGYYLEHEKTWGDHNCVKYSGGKKIMPGDSTFFEVEKNCPWGGVDFKVHKVKSDQYMGRMSYAVRDGSASMELKIKCKSDSECVFKGVMPEK